MISNLSSLLGSFSASLGSKVLASLGMGFVSFAGYAVVANQLVSMYQTEFNNKHKHQGINSLTNL